MALTSGAHLGPYAIISPIGAGGMGEVYKARDTRLNRDVAIKVLPEAFSADADRRARFDREAQAVAALSHPNILAIFDTGVHDGRTYVVTELLAGETLRERLGHGAALPARKATEIAIQIARGLAAAHEKGIVHRDIKPENLFILADGQVKILDFGLARTVAAGSGATATVAAMTDPGSVMGTVGYMAPEQVRAQPLDARTDLFSLGAVLYEMLTGQRAFQRDTAAETMTAILREDPPDLTATRANLSPALDRIVRHCLEKSPAERFQTARDVAFALEALSGSGTATSTTVAALPAGRSWLRPALWAASVVAAVAIGVFVQRRMAPADTPIQFETKTFDRQIMFNARFMPDDKTIVYSAARQDTTPELFILHPDSVAPQSIGGPGTHLLSVSSKGELAVLTGATYQGHRLFTGTLAKLSPGGSPHQLQEGIREADWSPSGEQLAVVHDLGNGHDALEFPIGTVLYEVNGYLSDLRVSRDGHRVAFVEHGFRFDDRGWIKVVDDAKKVVTLTGELWGAEGVAWSVDDAQVVFSGSEAARLGGVSYETSVVPASGRTPAHLALPSMTDVCILDIARDGRWLVTREDYRETLVIKKPGESAERDYAWLDHAQRPGLSLDGSMVAFTDQNSGAGPNYGVMLRRTDGSPAVRLGDGGVRLPAFSPDGKWVAADVLSKNQYVFYPTGPGQARHPDAHPDEFDFAGWFSDSQHVLLCGGHAAKRCAKYATSGGPPVPVGPDVVALGRVAPDDSVLVVDAEGKGWIYPPDGRPRISFNVPARKDNPVAFGANGFVFVTHDGPGRTVQIDRVEIPTMSRTPVATIPLPDGAGLRSFNVTSVIGEPGHYGYAYSYTRWLSTLVVASGVSVK